MSIISIIYTYYNQKTILEKYLNEWENYPQDILDKVKFIVIDDCSKNKAEDVIKQYRKNKENDTNDTNDTKNVFTFKYKFELCRINEDIYCNIPGAMNLGSHIANTEWLLHMDMDHSITTLNLKKIISLAESTHQTGIVYKFNRDIRSIPHMYSKNRSGFKFHPKLCLIRREDYWKVGGFDEDFCGNYGRTDTAFYTRGKDIVNVKLMNNIFLDVRIEGDTIEIDRSKLENNTKLLESKIKNGNWSTDVLRFLWNKVKIL